VLQVLRPEPETLERSKLESQAESNPKRNFRPPQGEKSSEDSMKRVFLLIVIPALLVALGFAQTPAASINTDQTNIKGCLGGSDGNYTIAQDNTGHIFKVTSSSVDLKPHLGHDVTLVGHKANSAATDSSLAVTELSMISEHCAAAAAAPIATVSTPAAAATTPTAPARRGSLSLLILFAVLVLVVGILTPPLNRWRKRKILARKGAPNLSLTREASSDQDKTDPQVPRKAA
jgi:hypothetical protein